MTCPDHFKLLDYNVLITHSIMMLYRQTSRCHSCTHVHLPGYAQDGGCLCPTRRIRSLWILELRNFALDIQSRAIDDIVVANDGIVVTAIAAIAVLASVAAVVAIIIRGVEARRCVGVQHVLHVYLSWVSRLHRYWLG